MKQKGFTLIELLVVIAIIAILAAILFPVFSSAKDAGRKAACLDNMKQLTAAMLLYVQDSDESFPMGYRAVTSPKYGFALVLAKSGQTKWGYCYWILKPYVKSEGILECPSDLNPKIMPAFCSYSYNAHYLSRITPSAQVLGPPAKMGEVRRASATVMFGENRPRVGWGVNDGTRTDHVYVPSSGGYDDWTTDRHNGGLCVGFVDGHVVWKLKNSELRKSDDLWDLK